MSIATLDQLDDELGKRWFQRRSPQLHQSFRIAHEQATRIVMGQACQWVGLLYIAFGAIDAVLIRDMLPYTLMLRLIIGSLYVAAIVMQVRNKVDTRILEYESALGIYVGFAAWLFLAAQSSDTTAMLYYAGYGLIFMFVANLFFDLSFKLALISSGLIAFTFLAWALEYANDRTYISSFVSLYAFSLLLTLFLNFKYNRERFRVYLNSCRAEIGHQEAIRRGEELYRLSTTDALTGLANRRAIDGVLQNLWVKSVELGEPFGVILIDVDFFKLYNDHYGHQQGDRCLAMLSKAMREVAERRRCALGRFGGEEFVALLSVSSATQVHAVAEEIRQVVETLCIPHSARRDQRSSVTVSIGAAYSTDIAGEKPERTVTAADLALYAAKDEGRDCVRIFDARMLDDGANNELNAEILRSALGDGRISAVFQPIVDVSLGHIWAAEALMRLRDAEGRSISPEAFIPVAERTGAILEMGEWILREACRFLAAEPNLPVVSVNISARQIANPRFVSTVREIVQAAGIEPSRLALEITESGQISGNPEVAKLMEQLSAAGIRVWLDDFGTGFAGLTCLSELRFDMVKIDRFFVQSCDTPRGAKLLKNIVDLVSNCAQKAIVEGVEEARQIELVSSFGVDLFQGYHLGRPMPSHELSHLLLGNTVSRASTMKSALAQ
ncbi:EAL domain-containing protein [Methylobacterium sp. E-005]|uniref:putative bifunctional diguanylate cyclase/phosphodiesterase n=1 Tax=Methylobacterium sp. E-005 TaxID=2836549 RepID=UPI001FB9D213|nr:GGDEF domain-containing phosphodiesterase [Methylobacterium sp. E-005]MCJ2087200.1 EAL domain-containing protein [Methylobacterium sp. E-005]